jgi:2-keto-4-pentenoate hydratase/2-oxohepta-3-ene-1,7-dioic acid hydratase in catechol pathway
LITFSQGSHPRPGVVLDDNLALDLSAAAPELGSSWVAMLSELDAVRELVDRYRDRRPADGERPAAPFVDLAGVKLLPPVPCPGKIIAVGLNYHDHAAEQNKPAPEKPIFFAKARTCLQAPFGPIELDADLDRVDAEAELAFVIGQRGRAIPVEDARDYIAGYMCFNDVSDRTAQYSDRQFFRGKSIDTGGPCGPWIVTPEELPDLAAGLRITARWNGESRQDSNTEQLIFPPDRLIAFASAHMTLEPGDIFATGTPSGVGVFRDPPSFLRPGDLVEVEIESIGRIANPVVRI